MPETTGKHPAPFTDSIIAKLGGLIRAEVPAGHVIHDPFGGDGVRLGALCDRTDYAFSATDLEHWRDSDRRVRLGDATHAGTYPTVPFAVVTSPTYNNGVNDHFLPADTSRRLTYRVAAGHALHENNTGRYSGRGSKSGEAAYWRLSREVVKHWPDIALVNVKDSTRAGLAYPLVILWRKLMVEHGYTVRPFRVRTPGWRYGANRGARVEFEVILVCRRNDA